MGTVVLPAQDRLAQERDRQQGGVMSGMIYPLGGLPRTRRKVKPPHQVVVAASLHSDVARSSDINNVHVTDSRSVSATPMDMLLGRLRSAPSSASTSHLPPSSVLKTPQYPRTRSDGVLGESLEQQGLKRGVDDRKRAALEKGADSSKKSAVQTLGKNGEKSSDRRKGLDRRAVEKKPVEKASTVQKKTGVITILRRPQTKEAAAENVALFTGRPIAGVTKQILKSALPMPQHVVEQSAVAAELVKDVEVSGKDGEIDNVSGSSANVSSNKGTKKKRSRNFSAKAASRTAAAEVVHVKSRRSEDAQLHRESRRPKTAPRPTGNTLAERRRADDEHKVAEPDADEASKSIDRGHNLSHVSPSSVDEIVLSWSNDGVSTFSEVLHPGPSDSLAGEIGQAFARQGVISRSGILRDGSRYNDNGVELFFLASSAPKRSERWAGPAYTNSPPPSTLPFPTFPLQREKTSMMEVTLADVVLREPRDTELETMSWSASPSPPRMASLLLSATAMQSPFVNPSSAMKDLRRMLNLDGEDSFAVSAEWSEGGVESATQSLKRMLQLG